MLHDDDDDNVVTLTSTVNKDKLLKAVRENLEKHEKEHTEALEGWQKRVMEQLEASTSLAAAMHDVARSGSSNGKWRKDLNPQELIPKDWNDRPVSYAKEYRDAIEMLEWTEEDSIPLTRTLFKQLVQDEWGWKGRHLRSVGKYTRRH